jgi:hypothetical protein
MIIERKAGQPLRQLSGRSDVMSDEYSACDTAQSIMAAKVRAGHGVAVSDGLPYLLRKFRATRAVTSTKAFDQAIIDGKPIATVPLAGPADHEQELPLDLWIVDLPD